LNKKVLVTGKQCCNDFVRRKN